MILPDNGKLIIIDDEPMDVKPLMDALTKEKMPFLFFTDRGGSDIPDDGPIKNVRLVFLDLDLGMGGNTPLEKIRHVQARIERLIEKQTPYVLVIWSTHEDQFLETLSNEFKGDFKDYNPLFCCSLDKSVIHQSGINIVQTIRDSLKKKLHSFESFNAFMLWESIVNRACGEIVNSFIKIFEADEMWDKKTQAFFYSLAHANAGEHTEELSGKQKLQLAFETINSALIDTIEKYIREKSGLVQLEIKDNGSKITEKNTIDINTKLHILYSEHLEHFIPGNIYFANPLDTSMIEPIVNDAFKDKKLIAEILSSTPIPFMVDVTPGCDYFTDKGYTRLLGGIIVEGKHKEKVKPKAYIYPHCPVINILGKDYYPILDFRYFKSIRHDNFKVMYEKPPKYKIRNQILTDLQANLASHINRPGIVTINPTKG